MSNCPQAMTPASIRYLLVLDDLCREGRGVRSVEIAARIIRECKPYCQGVHIMSLGWESKIPALLEQAGL